MLSVDVPPYGTGTQPITYHVRVNAGNGHLEAGFRRIFDGGFAGWMYVDGVLSPGDYALTDQFNTSAIYYSEYKFVEDAAPPPPPTPTLTVGVRGVDDSPIADVEVTVVPPGVMSRTGSDGSVTFNVGLGLAEIRLYKPGYQEQSRGVTIHSGSQTELFTLLLVSPPPTIQAKFFTLPAGRAGQRPSDYAAEDLHGTITVNGISYATPKTLGLTVGATVSLSAPGAVDWDYYGVGHVHSPEASYTVVATATEFAAFYEEAPPPPPPPPPPTVPLDVLAAVAGAALLLVLGGLASGMGTAIFQQWFTG